MASQIDIFILMAGMGTRFKRDEFKSPKPLIKFKEKPLFAWALKSVQDLLPLVNLHLVICAEDKIHEKVELELAKLSELNFHTVHIITLPQRTAGPLETAVQAVRQAATYESNNPVVFGDCDLYFDSPSWIKSLKKWKEDETSVDALLLTFNADAEKHSFVRVDEDGFATEVAEKKIISKNAVVGFYAFKNSKLFLQIANKVLDGMPASAGEYFISQVYNELIQAGKIVKVSEVEKLLLLGTPEELEQANSSRLPE